MERVRVGDVELAHEAFGDPGDPPLVLVMGLGVQLLGWREGFCAGLAEQGFHVVRFDNRDVGLSTHLEAHAPPYTLSDMAADTVGLIDALGLGPVHLVGASMGGMIAQAAAIEHPDRLLSLTSIMSTTGDRAVGGPTPQAWGALTAPPATTREEAVARAVASAAVIGSPAYPAEPAGLRERAGVAFDRSFDPDGVGRQLAAILAGGDRTAALRELRVPTLVVHGAADPLVDVSGGRATAAAIPGAELLVLDGMGHDLPEPLWPQVIAAIAAHARAAAAATGARA